MIRNPGIRSTRTGQSRPKEMLSASMLAEPRQPPGGTDSYLQIRYNSAAITDDRFLHAAA